MIVISAGRTKRMIEGAFSLCLSPEDAETIIATLEPVARKRSKSIRWVNIPATVTHEAPVGECLAWDDDPKGRA